MMTGAPGSNGWLVAADGRELILRELRVDAHARAGLARSVVRGFFENPYGEALELRMHVPVPADGAVARCEALFGERRIVGRVEPRTLAWHAYETALLEGRLAALLEEERASVFSLSIGNVPPRTGVALEIEVDHPLAWVSAGLWEWRFPTVVAPRYLGGKGRVADAGAIAVAVAADGPAPALAVALCIDDDRAALAEPHSPSHAVRCVSAWRRVETLPGARPDRDVVVRWRAADESPGARVAVARPPSELWGDHAGYALLTVVPPRLDAEPDVRRDLTIVVDASGSTRGRPFEQAKRIVADLVDSLEEGDALELVAFADGVERWAHGPCRVSARARAEARAWLGALASTGATEMTEAMRQVLLAPEREPDRQVVLVTDGLVGFEDEVVAVVREAVAADRLRVHCVGIGPAVNRALTAAVARVGGGVEVIVGAEDPTGEAVASVLAGTAPPLVADVALAGSALREMAAARTLDLCPGRPLRIPVAVQASGGTIEVTGRMRNRTFSTTVRVPPCEPGRGDPAIVRAFARERVAALELDPTPLSRARRDTLIEEIGCRFQIATRMTSWFASSEQAVVDGGRPPRREIVPQMLPGGLSAAGLGLDAAPSPSREIAGGMPSGAGIGEDRQGGGVPARWRQRLSQALPVAALVAAILLAFPDVRARVWEVVMRSSGWPATGTGTVGKDLVTVRGALVDRTDRELVVEFPMVGATRRARTVSWDPGTTAEVRFVDRPGARFAAVDARASTAAGPVPVGRPTRVALALPSAIDATVSSIVIGDSRHRIRVLLGGAP